MNLPRKICVVIINRANYARIKTALREINKHPDLELQIVAGSALLIERHGMAVDVIKREGFKVDAEVHMSVEGETPLTMAKSVGLGIIELTNVFNALKPDIVLTVADRFETMATAVAASYMNIPLAHTQGGEVTGSIDESVRHAITKLAHIHFPATSQSAERLIKMGEQPETILMTGCPAIDIVAELDATFTQEEKERINYLGVGAKIDLDQPYLLMSQHPVTTDYLNGYDQIMETLEAVRAIGIQTIALWPNIDAGSDAISKGMRIFRERDPNSNVRFIKNLNPDMYAKVLANAVCTVGNSSSFIREGSYLGTPGVVVGNRQQGREHGANVMVEVPYDRAEIQKSIMQQIAHGKYESDPIFGSGTAGEQIAKALSKVEVTLQKRLAY